jgi:nucleoside-diphosphate-sugar epimerase
VTGAVLLTGATGAVGRPLAAALLERGVERVYALTHAEPLGEHDGRVQPIAGDITAGAALGLAPRCLNAVTTSITGIVHAAADTRFDASLEVARRANALGARNVMDFAAKCPRLDRLLALSTTHVAGRRTGVILEDDLAHDAGFVNAYEASKFEAEQELRDAARRLPIGICRLSTVIGDSRTGHITRLGALHRAVRLMYASLAPMVPGSEDSPVDLIALDYAVAAIAWLATSGFTSGRTWHVSAGDDTIPAGELLDLTIECFHTYRPAWRTRAIARPALVDLETFELFRQSVEQVGDAGLRASTDVVSHFAPQLAFPKRFDTRRCEQALAGSAIGKPSAREAWRHVVRRLVQPSAPGPLALAEEPGRG